MKKSTDRKHKKCRICKEPYTPWNTLQKVCSPKCAIVHTNNEKLRDRKKDTKRRKEALKSKSDYIRETQAVINKYVRMRDAGKPCVSCGKPDDGSHQRHASHYRSTAACSALRFNLKNIFTSCQQCNTTKSGNIIEYRINLVKRYGEDYAQWLESQNQVIKYEIDYLRRLKKVFLRKIRLKEKRVLCDNIGYRVR